MSDIESVSVNIDGHDRMFYKFAGSLFSSYRDAESFMRAVIGTRFLTEAEFERLVEEEIDLDKVLELLYSEKLEEFHRVIRGFVKNKYIEVYRDESRLVTDSLSGECLEHWVYSVLKKYAVKNNLVVKEFPFLKIFVLT